jgi:hypothetical protein
MKVGVIPDDVAERLAFLSGMLVPPGIFECWFGIMLAGTVSTPCTKGRQPMVLG